MAVRGRVMEAGVDTGSGIRFLAAAPPDRGGSYSGSGLPFASASQAFFNTPNVGSAPLGPDGSFELRLPTMPNAYYAGVGTVLVPPCVHLTYTCDGRARTRTTAVELAAVAVPHRLLTYPASRRDPTFYQAPSPPTAQTQEAIIRGAVWAV